MASLERYPCDVCGKDYGSVGHLNRHKRVHTDERPYKCRQCHKSFMRKDHLDDHTFTHTTHRPFACNQCDTKFYTKQKLNRHKILHERPKPHVCGDCNQAFVKKNQLARHRVEHTGKQPFPCLEPDCDKAFSVPSALKRHQEHRHSLSTYLCIEPGCTADPFTKFSMLQRHLKLHRPKQPHACDGCGKRFRNASSLNKHKSTHQLPAVDRMTHKCRFPGCIAAYTSSGNLGTHVRSQHLNRQAYSCDLCKSRFSVKSSYERHLRNLHGDNEQKFSCKECYTKLPSRAALRRHLRAQHKHTGSTKNDEESSCIKQEVAVSDEGQLVKAASTSNSLTRAGEIYAAQDEDTPSLVTMERDTKEFSSDKCTAIEAKRKEELALMGRHSGASPRRIRRVDGRISEEDEPPAKRRQVDGRSSAHRLHVEAVTSTLQTLESDGGPACRTGRNMHAVWS